ncbi:MAG TPA: sialidase family protein [Longimicrobiaceae bacterium]
MNARSLLRPVAALLLLDAPLAAQVEVSEFIYEDPPTPQCHASTIVETPEGLVAAWFGGEHERHPSVGIWVARHENGQWTRPAEVANGLQLDGTRYPTWNPVLFQPEGGPLMLFYKVGPSPSQWWGMRVVSHDGGRTWSEPERLGEGLIGPVKNKPVVLPNGDILAGSSTEHDGWRVHFERSTDGGKTWTRTPPVNDGRQIGAIQPSILFHPDGRLQAIGRTRQDRLFTIESRDGGHTWGPMSLLDVPNPSAGTDAITLTDGRHLLAYNPTTSADGDNDRSTLSVALSEDGVHWQQVLVLENEPGKEFSYPAVIQTSDGLVHITYTWDRKRVKHVVLDPAKLQAAAPDQDRPR